MKIHEEISSSINGISTFDSNCTLENGILNYLEDHTSVEINLDKKIIIKDDVNKKIVMNFKLNSGYYLIKDNNFKIYLNIYTNSFETSNNFIHIDYDLKINDENMGNFKINIDISNK